MAGKIGKEDASVIDRLLAQPHRFSFYQAVRLLLASGGAAQLGAPSGEIGTTKNASEESIRFQSTPALGFPAAEIVSVGQGEKSSATDDQHGDKLRPVAMEVAFWGLFGPVGALPSHYTQLVIDRVHDKDFALRDFLDLFSHRQLSLFYRSWEKCFVPAGFERGLRTGNAEADQLREALLSLTGRGTKRVRDLLEILDDVLVYYGGAFVDRPNAESLAQIVSDFSGLRAVVLSLFGQWLRLPIPEQSRIGLRSGHSALGLDTVLGETIWDPASKFRVCVGPVSYIDFQRLMPTGDQLVPICQLTRSYVGCEFSFDVQVILLAEQIPSCRLDVGTNARLGWNTWLCSRTPTRDSDDAVFHHDGAPVLV